MLFVRWRYRGRQMYVCGVPVRVSDSAPAGAMRSEK